MEFISSEKQRALIALHIEKNQEEHAMFKEIMELIPMHNEKHPDTRVNNQRMILLDMLDSLTITEADYVIKAYVMGWRGYHPKVARGILVKRLTPQLNKLKEKL